MVDGYVLYIVLQYSRIGDVPLEVENQQPRQAVLDGFIVSDNVQARAVNVDVDYAYSDHNPVMLEFSLK